MSLGRRMVDYAGKILAFAVFTSLIDYSEAVDYGKGCDHDDDCHDFRLMCSMSSNTCVCSRFFDWIPESKVCDLDMSELRHFLASLGEERDYRAELDAEARKTFNHIGFAGILALSLGILGATSCVFLFCIIDRKPDRDHALKVQPSASKPAPAPVEKPQASAQIDTMVPGVSNVPIGLPMIV